MKCTQGGSGEEEVGEVYTGWEWRGRDRRCVHREGVQRKRPLRCTKGDRIEDQAPDFYRGWTTRHTGKLSVNGGCSFTTGRELKSIQAGQDNNLGNLDVQTLLERAKTKLACMSGGRNPCLNMVLHVT